MPLIEIVTVGRRWITRVEQDGRVFHYGPWATQWAAQKCADILALGYYLPKTDGAVTAPRYTGRKR